MDLTSPSPRAGPSHRVELLPDFLQPCDVGHVNATYIAASSDTLSSVEFLGIAVPTGQLDASQRQRFLALLNEFSDIFDTEGEMILPPHSEFDHRIILKDPYRISRALFFGVQDNKFPITILLVIV